MKLCLVLHQKLKALKKYFRINTRVYIAHIEGVPIEEMVQTAKRISNEGFNVMPHFPARIIKDKSTLEAMDKKLSR